MTQNGSCPSEEWKLEVSSAIDSSFLIIMGCLVFFMHFGFGFLEAGSVRKVQWKLDLADTD